MEKRKTFYDSEMALFDERVQKSARKQVEVETYQNPWELTNFMISKD